MTPVRPSRLISISDDDSLRYSREMILRNDGYEIVSISSHALLEDLLQTPFDVAIICQSVESGRGDRMIETLRQRNPGIRVLRITRDRNGALYPFEVEFEVPAGPTALLQALAALRGEVRRSA